MNIFKKEVITNDKLYEQKYLIYKSKYLKIKNQIGGIFKVGDTTGEPEVIIMSKFIEKLRLKCSELQLLCETHSKSELFSIIITLSKSSKEEILKKDETTIIKNLKNFMNYDDMLDFCKNILEKIKKEEKLTQNEEYCLEYVSMIMDIENMDIANMKEYEISNKLVSPIKHWQKDSIMSDLMQKISYQFEAHSAFLNYSWWLWRISRHGRHDGSPSKDIRTKTSDEIIELKVKEEKRNKRIQEISLKKTEMKDEYDKIIMLINKIIDILKLLKIKISQPQIFFPSNFDLKIFNEIKSDYENFLLALQDLKTQINIFNNKWEPLCENYLCEKKEIIKDPILLSWDRAQSNGISFYGKI